MDLNFCFDHESSPGVLGYPNLAKPNLGPDDFDVTYPRTLPCRLFVYFKESGINAKTWNVSNAPMGSWYPIALGWHDFDCDYLALVPTRTMQRIAAKEIKILFYYHEGDNPFTIKQRLEYLCHKHRLPANSYLFISANSKASDIENFHYFPDHEFFFRFLNKRQTVQKPTLQIRQKDFTILSRTHKWWRSAVMADLHRFNLLDNSLWSYNTSVLVEDDIENNPIQVNVLRGWSDSMEQFFANGPYVCDSNDEQGHNDHRTINTDLYQSSYCHLILETLFDADQSGGAFLTEKTFKCIKFGQPFIIIGTPGSLECLRNAGYRVFDSCTDNSYDTILDNTKRWLAIRGLISNLKEQGLYQWYQQCIPDVLHNQEIFLHRYQKQLLTLKGRLCQE